MSLFKLLLILPIVALTACGFEPAYGNKGSANSLLGNVLVQEPATKNAYDLTKYLESRLGRTANPEFDLGLSVSSSQAALNINEEGNIERYNMIGNANYTLRSRATGQIISSGSVNGFTGYSATSTTVAAQASKQDAEKRLMVILGDLILDHILTNAALPS